MRNELTSDESQLTNAAVYLRRTASISGGGNDRLSFVFSSVLLLQFRSLRIYLQRLRPAPPEGQRIMQISGQL